MPDALQHRCPVCRRLVVGRCPTCHQTRHQRLDRRRGTAWTRGYDTAWQKLRAAHLAAFPLCAHCEADGQTVPARHVDHVVPFDGPHDARRLDPDNLQSLCVSCHSRKTATEDSCFAKSKGSDRHGQGAYQDRPAGRNSAVQLKGDRWLGLA
jgi:5-methylcytosine-specific restriction protein A